MNDAFASLLHSSRVSSPTRAALEARAEPRDPWDGPMTLGIGAFATLAAVLDRVIPQEESSRIDLAMLIDRQLTDGVGDGWRFAALPLDAGAYDKALATLHRAALAAHGVEFPALENGFQDHLLCLAQAGSLHVGAASAGTGAVLDAGQMQAWFEDLRADAVRVFVSHPRTLQWLGYSGFGNGGDGEPKSGFVRVGLGEREAWEPVPTPKDAP